MTPAPDAPETRQRFSEDQIASIASAVESAYWRGHSRGVWDVIYIMFFAALLSTMLLRGVKPE